MTARIGVQRAVTRVSGNYKPQDALAAGYVWATVAPKGHIVCVHRNEEIARRFAQLGLRNTGCTVAPIESLLQGPLPEVFEAR